MWRKKIGAPGKSPENALLASKFPPVQNVPIELAPFEKKVQIATKNQRLNEKKLIHEQMLYNRMGTYNRYKLEMHRKLKEESIQPNAINEKKVKLWSQLMSRYDNQP